MVVNIFGEKTSSKGKDGKPGPPGHAAVLKELIQWFPEFMLEELRSSMNTLTFKINVLNTDVGTKKDKWDVELSIDGKYINKWRCYNNSRKIILKPIFNAGCIEKITLPHEGKQSYGLVFEKKRKIMYFIDECEDDYLSVKTNDILLTMTFCVGHYHLSDTSKKTMEDQPSDDEQYIISDHKYLDYAPKQHGCRGLYIKIVDTKHFDLYLQGGKVSESTKENVLKINKDPLKMFCFYTIQVFWKNQLIDLFGTKSSHVSLFHNEECVVDRLEFFSNPIEEWTSQELYLGGYNNSMSSSMVEKPNNDNEIVASKLFNGIISQIELLKPNNNQKIPAELSTFIVQNQIIYDF